MPFRRGVSPPDGHAGGRAGTTRSPESLARSASRRNPMSAAPLSFGARSRPVDCAAAGRYRHSGFDPSRLFINYIFVTFYYMIFFIFVNLYSIFLLLFFFGNGFEIGRLRERLYFRPAMGFKKVAILHKLTGASLR